MDSEHAHTHRTAPLPPPPSGDGREMVTDALDEKAAQALRETNVTWELIAELSKGETTDVYTMILNNYEGKEGTEKHYLRYPSEYVGELFAKLRTDVLLQKLGIALPDGVEIPAAAGKPGKKSKREKKGKQGGEADAPKPRAKAKGKKGRERVEGRKAGGTKMSKADMIRNKQLVSRAVSDAQDFALPSLRFDFTSHIVEVVLLYYMHVAFNALQAKRVSDFLEAIFSLRDAYLYFSSATYGVDAAVQSVVRDFLGVAQRRFPWKNFLMNHTRFLIKNHFRTRFQRALKPFREQQELLTQLREEPHSLYVLPWGVGAGKTALIAPLSYIYDRMGYQTLYCVPFGPVRDQSAALLYRCGIPFAYVAHNHGDQFELQPSYHCGNEKMPTVLIVDPSFVRYYITYWESFRALVDDDDALDPTENPPNVRIPSDKRRYRHISHAMWNPRMALVLDEPSEGHPDLMWVLSQLPETSFVMSATACGLVDETVRDRYRAQHGKEPRTIEASTIGVATTLVGRWLESAPILSPFSGSTSRDLFESKYRYIQRNILWRRFLSPEVMVEWFVKAQRMRPALAARLDTTFDLMTLTFDSISERMMRWCEIMLELKPSPAPAGDDAEGVEGAALDDAFFREFCAFPDDSATPVSQMLRESLTSKAHTLMGGCVIGVPSVASMYDSFQEELRDFPTVAEVQRRARDNNVRVREMYEAVNKMTISKEEDRHRKEDRKREIEQQRLTQLPIDEKLIINTPEHVQSHISLRCLRGAPVFTRVQELMEDSDPSEDLRAWKIYPDIIPQLDETYLRWRWKGVGSICHNKEFNMKNIRDSESGNYLSFLGVDAVGAHGLNLKITHGMLCEDARGRMLPVSIMLQVAGRVGRWGQDSCGYVHLASRGIFDAIFA